MGPAQAPEGQLRIPGSWGLGGSGGLGVRLSGPTAASAACGRAGTPTKGALCGLWDVYADVRPHGTSCVVWHRAGADMMVPGAGAGAPHSGAFHNQPFGTREEGGCSRGDHSCGLARKDGTRTERLAGHREGPRRVSGLLCAPHPPRLRRSEGLVQELTAHAHRGRPRQAAGEQAG